jgi:hypothetical protein
MSKFLCYSFLVVLSLTMCRSPVTSAWVPSLTTTMRTIISRRTGLLIASAPLQRRRVVASYLSGSPSTSTRDRATFSTSSTLHQHSADTSSDAENGDMDQQNSRRRFLVQTTMRAAATITASTTLLTIAPTPAHAAGATDETIQKQSKSVPDPFAKNNSTPPKWPEEALSPLPSPWTNMSPPSFDSEYDSNGGAGADTSTDFSRAMQKAAKQKQVDPRTHG